MAYSSTIFDTPSVYGNPNDCYSTYVLRLLEGESYTHGMEVLSQYVGIHFLQQEEFIYRQTGWTECVEGWNRWVNNNRLLLILPKRNFEKDLKDNFTKIYNSNAGEDSRKCLQSQAEYGKTIFKKKKSLISTIAYFYNRK